MKTLPIAAAALLFGTSAYAMVPADKDNYPVTGMAAVAPAGDALKLQPAAATWYAAAADSDAALNAGTDADEAAWAADAAAKASADKADVDGDADAATAEAEGEAAVEPAIEQLEPVATEPNAVEDEPVPVEGGVGGPFEAPDSAAADLTPRPAAQNYPACRPGPGDDNCIQLYEPGVRQQLAAWTRPTGGFAGSGDSQVAMGGPYEPVDNSAVESARQDAMSGDGTVDTALGETGADEKVV